MVYRPTSWNKINKGEDAPAFLPISGKMKPDEKPQKQSAGILSELLGVIDYIRKLIVKNEDFILFIIILLILADSDDNIELLIALAILFFPSLSGLIPGLFRK
jgi:hypothetical protein